VWSGTALTDWSDVRFGSRILSINAGGLEITAPDGEEATCEAAAVAGWIPLIRGSAGVGRGGSAETVFAKIAGAATPWRTAVVAGSSGSGGAFVARTETASAPDANVEGMLGAGRGDAAGTSDTVGAGAGSR
jgi:hypothetical protein